MRHPDAVNDNTLAVIVDYFLCHSSLLAFAGHIVKRRSQRLKRTLCFEETRIVDLSDPTWIIAAASIVAVVVAYVDMRWRMTREEKASSELAAVIKLMREELELFRKQAQTGQLTSQETQRLQTIQKANENIWKNLQNMLKTVKLFKEVFPEED